MVNSEGKLSEDKIQTYKDISYFIFYAVMYFKKLQFTFTKNKGYYLIIVNSAYTFTAKYINKLINSYHRISDATDEMSHNPMSL